MRKNILKVFALILVSSASFAASPSAENLKTVVRALNLACGDEWCVGGDYTYHFNAAEFVDRANRLTISFSSKSLTGTTVSRKMKCIIYNFHDMSQLLDQRGAISQAFSTEITNCLDTVEANFSGF